MVKLEKWENGVFSEYYEGRNGGRVVVCILDDNCVHYTVRKKVGGKLKQVARREYGNASKARCLAAAEKALNR